MIAVVLWVLLALAVTGLAVLAYVRRVLCPWSALVGLAVGAAWAGLVLAVT